MLIINEEDLCNQLRKFTLDDALPVKIRVKHQDNEIVLSEYSNLPV